MLQSAGQKQKCPTNGHIGYMTPAIPGLCTSDFVARSIALRSPKRQGICSQSGDLSGNSDFVPRFATLQTRRTTCIM